MERERGRERMGDIMCVSEWRERMRGVRMEREIEL
jgi:hypothetical protein